MRAFDDLGDLPEDERIAKIAETAKLYAGDIVGVAVDDEPDKVERYKRKLRARGLSIIKVTPGPVAGAQLISVRFSH